MDKPKLIADIEIDWTEAELQNFSPEVVAQKYGTAMTEIQQKINQALKEALEASTNRDFGSEEAVNIYVASGAIAKVLKLPEKRFISWWEIGLERCDYLFDSLKEPEVINAESSQSPPRVTRLKCYW